MKAIKMRATIGKDGRLTLTPLPLRRGSQVEVIVLEQEPGENGLLEAAESSLAFWDNEIDDRIWNDA
jgi:hypothetical protein